MKINKILIDVRFWIVFFFIIRLFGITNPPLEIGHNWRQTTVTMVARNFLEINNNIFYPRIDIAGEKTGITGMEFPLLNYLIYVIAELFGYQHWYGRLINLIISSIGLLFFYKLLRKYFLERVSLYATIILTVSIWFQFSRKIMPDTFAMSMIIASIYYGTSYLETKQRKKQFLYLLTYFFLMMLGTLSKIPSAYLFIIFLIYFFNKQIATERKIVFLIVSLLGIIPVIFWYYYWVPYLVHKYDFWHFFMGKSLTQGFSEIIQNTNQTLNKFYDVALKFIGFTAFVYGLVKSIIRKNWKIYLLFVLPLISFSIIIIKAGYTFTHHSYYIIPFVPVMALVAGYGLSEIGNSKIALLILISISIEGIANQQHDFILSEKNKRILNIEKDIHKVTHQSDLIVINSGNFPTPMYFSHRKGWVTSNEKIKNDEYIDELKNKGLKYIVILKRTFGTEIELTQHEKILDNEDYCIYKVQF